MIALRSAGTTRRRVLGTSTLVLVSALTAVAVPAPARAAATFGTSFSLSTAAHVVTTTAVGDFPQGRLALSADITGTLRAMRGDGSVAWQVGIDPLPGAVSASESSPAVGDLDGDGVNDIVIGAGAIDPRDRRDQGGVVAYDHTGRVKWRFRTRDTFNVYTGGAADGLSDGVVTTPAIGDVDGDGINDVVFGGLDHFIYALRGSDGTLLPGFPYDNRDTVFSSPSLQDVDGDPALEILVGGDATIDPPIGWYARGTFRALDVTLTGVRQLWMRTFQDVVSSSPAIGDLNGDGRLDAVFSTGGFYNDNLDSRRVWAVDAATGGDLPGWPQTTDGLLRTSPALGDVVPGDGGRPEVVLGDTDGTVYAFRGSGARAWTTHPGSAASGGRGNNGGGYEGGATISDLDGDGDQDVALGYGLGGALLIDGRTGALQRMVGGPLNATIGAPAVIDFGGTVGRQMLLLGWQPTVPGYTAGAITSVRLPATSAAADWPLFHGSARRLGGPVSPREGESPDFVRSLYADLLGRAPAPAEVQSWSRTISLGADRTIGASGIGNSEEYRRRVISSAYVSLLGRPAEPAGMSSWLAELASGRTTLDDLPRRLMGSQEFYLRAGGTDRGFADLLYRRALARPASADEQSLWAATVAAAGRGEAVRGIYDSYESLLQRVNRSYVRWLNRPAGPSEQAYWAATISQGGDDRARVALMISPEYLALARSR